MEALRFGLHTRSTYPYIITTWVLNHQKLSSIVSNTLHSPPNPISASQNVMEDDFLNTGTYLVQERSFLGDD